MLFVNEIPILTTLTKSSYISLVDNIPLRSKTSIMKSLTKKVDQFNNQGFNINCGLTNP